MLGWQVGTEKPPQILASSDKAGGEAKVAFGRNFEFRLPLPLLAAAPVPVVRASEKKASFATKVRVRFSLWKDHLPADALPLEGWIELQLLSEDELMALA